MFCASNESRSQSLVVPTPDVLLAQIISFPPQLASVVQRTQIGAWIQADKREYERSSQTWQIHPVGHCLGRVQFCTSAVARAKSTGVDITSVER
jgi:hypothetical protein